MKRLIFLSYLISNFAFLTTAPPVHAHDSAGVQQSLLQLEREWSNAMAKNDAQTIDRIEAADFAYVLDGMRGDKQMDLADARSKAFSGSAELLDMKARVYGDAAVVTGTATLRNAKYKGKDVSGDYFFTDTFVKKDGRWQVVASHANRVKGM
ncbi:MAG TPA: nuclear transport factor 2 family protein [Bryobacteraceae bacterium]|jgi:ketosteroid isomerase-like protein|nr:nuclear transport factor 2 family protein [Bryobacteraceae bacterium]